MSKPQETLTSNNLPFEGARVKLQNMSLIIPPLNFRLLRREGAAQKLQKIFDYFESTTKEQQSAAIVSIPDEIMDDITELVWQAARRNYPELTREDIEDGLDYNNAPGIMTLLAYQNPINAVKNQGNEPTPQAKK